MTSTNASLRLLCTAVSTMLVLACALPLPAFANSPPVLSLPGSIAVEATSPSGATVSFTATASDANPVSPTLTCTPISGSTFPLGTTVVTCSATGASGTTAHGSFTVRVQDTRPPVISTEPDIILEATGPTGAPVTYPGPTATDVGGPVNPTVTCTPASGSTFPLGTTVVKCFATDAAGNAASATFGVTVVDTPHSIAVPAE